MADEDVLSLDAIDLSSPIASPAKAAAAPAATPEPKLEKKPSVSLTEDGFSLDDIEQQPTHVGGQRGAELSSYTVLFLFFLEERLFLQMKFHLSAEIEDSS